MKKFIVAAVISTVALVGCSSNTEANPAPVVTITEQAPAPEYEGNTSSVDMYLDFVRDNGGPYARAATSSQLIDLGNTICDGIRGGLSDEDIVYAISSALVKAGMGNDDGATLGAALLVGSRNYLCGAQSF